MAAHDSFHRFLKRDFFPLLRAEGFKGSGTTLRRMKGEQIDVVNVQGSSSGGRCYVNLSVHFSFLPTEGGRVVAPKELKEYQCAFRERLHKPKGSDHWWDYGADDAEAEASVADLVASYQRNGEPFFRQFEPFPDIFERVTPAQLEAGDFSQVPTRMTGVHTALIMARIMHHLGRREQCRAFAEVGLRNLGRAVALKAEFERLRDGI